MSSQVDVIAIGNAIMDILSFVEDHFLITNNLEKGSMSLVTEDQFQALLSQVSPSLYCAGGSSCNSLAGVSSLGGKSAFIGRIKNDSLGGIFRQSLQTSDIAFQTIPRAEGPATGSCLIFVTPDGERTMRTYLGASIDLSHEDVSEKLIKKSKILFIEAYLFDPLPAFEANIIATKIAKSAGNKVALSTCDVSCVKSHRDALITYIKTHTDILITNYSEALSLTQAPTLEEAVPLLQSWCPLTAITCNDKGSLIIDQNRYYEIEPADTSPVVDTTGAGDLYASGFLYGYTQGFDLETCGRVATLAAGEVISHLGARPQTPLKGLLSKALS